MIARQSHTSNSTAAALRLRARTMPATWFHMDTRKGRTRLRSTPSSFSIRRGSVVEYQRSAIIFSQGDPGTSVMYIQRGGVKLSVRSGAGKEAVVAVLGPGDFFGEGCLAGQPLRIGTATAMTPSTVLIVDKRKMLPKWKSRSPCRTITSRQSSTASR
jgi:CRP-like cAMP-binding protein